VSSTAWLEYGVALRPGVGEKEKWVDGPIPTTQEPGRMKRGTGGLVFLGTGHPKIATLFL
jgi:hypothetical protein